MISTEEFIAMDALARVKAVDDAYGAGALQLASMQKTSGVLMHLIHRLGAKTTILFVDTQYHFPETLAIRDEFIARYGLNIVTVLPEMTPAEQERHYGRLLYNYVDGQPECCELRKEKPFMKFAREHHIRAVINGITREDGGTRRRGAGPYGHDPRIPAEVYSPIFDWTEEHVDQYLAEHNVPVHPLYAKSYASIGCATCTTPIAPGEDKRAGRWRHLRDEDGRKPEYCGINFSDMGQGI